jgi:hypothetical protein
LLDFIADSLCWILFAHSFKGKEGCYFQDAFARIPAFQSL